MRPPRLPDAAARVVKASGLTLAEKLIWQEDLLLDRGSEGCWLPPTELGARLSLDGDSVKAIRWRLKRMGLYVMVFREGAKHPEGWVPTLPPQCVPSRKPSVKEVALLAVELNAHVAVNRGSPARERDPSGGREPPSPGAGTGILGGGNGDSLDREPPFTAPTDRGSEERKAGENTNSPDSDQLTDHSPALGRRREFAREPEQRGEPVRIDELIRRMAE